MITPTRISNGTAVEILAIKLAEMALNEAARGDAAAAMLIAATVLMNGGRPPAAKLIEVVNDASSRIALLLSESVTSDVTPSG